MWAKVNSYNIWWILVPYSDSFRICFSLHKISRTLNKNSCSVCVCIKVFCFFQSQVLIYWRRQISQIWLTYSAIGSSHMPKRLLSGARCMFFTNLWAPAMKWKVGASTNVMHMISSLFETWIGVHRRSDYSFMVHDCGQHFPHYM